VPARPRTRAGSVVRRHCPAEGSRWASGPLGFVSLNAATSAAFEVAIAPDAPRIGAGVEEGGEEASARPRVGNARCEVEGRIAVQPVGQIDVGPCAEGSSPPYGLRPSQSAHPRYRGAARRLRATGSGHCAAHRRGALGAAREPDAPVV
jgi:hypothetical protein